MEYEKNHSGNSMRHLLDTIAACGDVNRNVMCKPNPYQSEIHSEVYEWVEKIK